MEKLNCVCGCLAYPLSSVFQHIEMWHKNIKNNDDFLKSAVCKIAFFLVLASVLSLSRSLPDKEITNSVFSSVSCTFGIASD